LIMILINKPYFLPRKRKPSFYPTLHGGC